MAKQKLTASSYQVVGVIPGPVVWKGKEIDLSQLDDAGFKKLFTQGCPYIALVNNDTSVEVS